jgi:adenine-specific DNA-methyltransferase
MNGGSGLALQHEYVVWRTNLKKPIKMLNQSILSMLAKVEELIKREGVVNEKVRKEFAQWVTKNKNLSGGEKAYKLIDDNGNIYRGVSLRAPEPRKDQKFFKPLIHPITNKPCSVPPNGFSRTPETLQNMMKNGEIIFGSDETTQPQQKKLLTEDSNRQLSSMIQNAVKGKTEMTALGLDFPYCHSSIFYQELIGPALQESTGVLLDFFAGSGTSGNAVINLNKIDEGNRKYILIEMGIYSLSITKPRIQKVIYSQNWKDGKPLDIDGSNKHIFKYFVLEQYEDVLDAIEQFEGETPKNLPLKYLYKPELNKINSTLDLSKPFSNKIKYGQPTKEGFVDLVDTYNYLQGYEVKSIKTYNIGKKYYKVVETTDTLVIWRDIALGEDDSKAIIEIVDNYPEATQIEVNYDFNILATLKDKQLEIGKRLLELTVIHSDIFNQ